MQAPTSEFLYHCHSPDRLLFLFTFDAWNAMIISVLIRNVFIGKDRNLTQSSLSQNQKSNTIMWGQVIFRKDRMWEWLIRVTVGSSRVMIGLLETRNQDPSPANSLSTCHLCFTLCCGLPLSYSSGSAQAPGNTAVLSEQYPTTIHPNKPTSTWNL